MGILDFLKNNNVTSMKYRTHNIDNVVLAEYLFSTLVLGETVPKEYQSVVEKECCACDINNNGYPDRQMLLSRIIELVDGTETPRQRYILAKAYSWSHAEYREKAIKYLNLYLNNSLYEGAYNRNYIPEDKENPRSWVSAKNTHLYDMYTALGDCYLGEYMYEEALNAYVQANRYAPSFASTWSKMAKTYIRMNDLQSALNVFQDAKNTSYYSKRYWHDSISGEDREIDFWKCIDSGEQDIKDKIAKGYKYKPRKRKAKI